MSECKLTGAIELRAKLKEIDTKVSKTYLRQALRAGAKVIQQACLQAAPVKTGQTKRAIKVRAAKRSRKGITMMVSIGKGMFTGDTFYAGFLEYGYTRKNFREQGNWAKAGKQGQFTKSSVAKIVRPGGRVELHEQEQQKIPGKKWLHKAFQKAQEQAAQAVRAKLAELLKGDLK